MHSHAMLTCCKICRSKWVQRKHWNKKAWYTHHWISRQQRMNNLTMKKNRRKITPLLGVTIWTQITHDAHRLLTSRSDHDISSCSPSLFPGQRRRTPDQLAALCLKTSHHINLESTSAQSSNNKPYNYKRKCQVTFWASNLPYFWDFYTRIVNILKNGVKLLWYVNVICK